jgi:hypothetical protein
MRLFESHPDLSVISYTFYDAFFFGPEHLSRMRPGSQNEEATYQSRFNQLQKFIADAEAAGKIPFIKEHLNFITDPQVIAANIICVPNGTPYVPNARPTIEDSTSALEKSISLPANPTVLPNDFLKTLSPVILIRHPAKIIPSFYRVSKATNGVMVFDEDFPAYASLRWLRLIFDWYEEYYSISKIEQRPIVIDMEDMINDPHNIAEKLCVIIGLDPKYVQYSWAEKTDECSLLTAVFLSMLRKSTGIISGDQVSLTGYPLGSEYL